ncbi:MAG TPA: NAD(P)/FAD-dependent oxidoreductase [Casimicrobiaceae bacterium]|nr:NAD(P)/FAD-dependent oxidoreductase [Casimicrobiaceae bacterium]
MSDASGARERFDVVVIGAGPAGIVAALRAGDLGARTALITRGEIGGMAAHDGPVPVRTLAHAARLIRDARQLGRYGIAVGEPALDYARLLSRVRAVVDDVREHAVLGRQLEAADVIVYEDAGATRFLDAHTLATERGPRLVADKIVICTGGVSRRLDVPGFELTATHSDAWSLTSIPASMIVLGAGATGVQVASIFNAFGTRVDLFQTGARILAKEDADVSRAVAEAFRRAGMGVHEAFGAVERFEKTSAGVRMVFGKHGARDSLEAVLVVAAVGWTANTGALDLANAAVDTDARGFIRVDAQLRTSARHVFAAGDVTGRLMLVPQALQDGFVAGTNAARGATSTVGEGVTPIGSFTDPEYAQVGLTEDSARATHDVVVTTVRFDETTRTIIDGRTFGFCKLIVDRRTRTIVGCHVVGERAVEIVQTAAIAMAGGMRVDELASIPLSFPTYTGMLGRAAAVASRRLNVDERRSELTTTP